MDPEQHGGELTIEDQSGLVSAATPCELLAGGVCFFCYGVAHCTLPNPTPKPRCAVAYHFVDQDEIDAGAGVSPRVRRYLTGPRATDGLREYGGWGSDGTAELTAAECWEREVAAIHQGEFAPALPHASDADRAAAAEMLRGEAAGQAERRGGAAL